MSRTIIPKKSTVADKVPLATDLEPGEIATNLTDGIIYSKHTDGSIVNLTGALELHTHSISQVTNLQSALDAKVDDSEFTNANIKTMYELNADTNAYTDSEKSKLGGIEAGAEVNVVTSVNTYTGDVSLLKADVGLGQVRNVASYSQTEADSTFAPISHSHNYDNYGGWGLTVDGVSQGNIASAESVDFVGGTNVSLAYDATGNVITISSTDTNTDTTYTAGTGLTLTGTEFSLTDEAYTTAEKNKLAGIESGATGDQTASEIKTAYESNTDTNAFTDALQSKLDGIEAGATGDQTASEILTAIKTVDGTTSGLDADLLDGQHASAFATSAQGDLADTAVQPADLSTVATTGSYNDLTNKPDLSSLEDVQVFATDTNFPATGSTGVVYIAEDTGYMYRWNGTGYTQMTDQTAIWGQISGTLSDQTDLQTALNGKAASSHSHGSGDLPATIMYEGENISLLTNDAGYISSETYSTATEIKTAYESNTDTNAYTDSEKTKLSGIAASADNYGGWNLSTNGVSQGTIGSSESVDLVGGTNITLSYNATGNVITIASDASANSYTAGAGLTLSGSEFSLTGESYTTTEKNKLAGIESGAEVNTVDSVAGKTGVVTLAAGDVGLGSVRNVASYSQTEADGRFASTTGDDFTGTYTINTTDDGVNDLQVGGPSRFEGNVGFGDSSPDEKVDVAGNARIQNENAMKFGGTGAADAQYAIQYNAATKSLDFNMIGS